MKGVVSWFAENHVAANLLMLFLLFAGAVTGLTMKIEVFPEFSLDRITVTTEYPGASPAEVFKEAFSAIYEKITSPAVTDIFNKGLKSLGIGLEKVQETAKKSMESAKKSVEDVKGKLKGLFGN